MTRTITIQYPPTIILYTNLSVLIHLVVGQLDLLERNDLLPQLLTRKRRVRVGVDPAGY